MAIAFVQSRSSGTSTDPNSLAFSSNVTAGNLIVVTCRDSLGAGGSTFDVSDNLENTYAEAFVGTAGGNGTLGIFYAMNISGGACTVSVDASSASTATRMTIHEFSGVATSAALDSVSNSANTTGSTLDTGNVTPNQADSLLFAGCGTSSNVTFTGAGSGWTLGPVGASRVVGAHQIVSSSTTYSATFSWTGTDNGAGAAIVVFKAPSSGSSTAAAGNKYILKYLMGAG